jgi:hypothetical protein
MVNYKVNFLNVEDTEKFTAGVYSRWSDNQKFIGLGIYSERAAQLLASVIRYKWNETRSGRSGRTVGGGLIVQTNGDVAINCHGEVGILFRKYDNIGKFLRVACGPAEQIKSIKDKLANDLKNFWNYKTEFCNPCKTSDNGLEIDIEGCTDVGERFEAKINYNEFRTLYEVLKGRDPKKIKAKYGTANFKEMIGEKNEDQFALMATETIMAEINKLVKERESEAKRLEEEHRQFNNEMWKKQKDEKEASKNFYNNKIKELEDQIKMMRTGLQFTF